MLYPVDTPMTDWRIRAYPIQVRIFPTPSDRTKWALYSRHRDWGETARRAYVEATNAHLGALVELVDSRSTVGVSTG
jgi:hypothetical protein